MSNAPTNNPNLETLDEELVAYLDGELDSQAAQRVENLLGMDEQARKRLNQLAASWDLLEQLPRATVDDLFTRTTVEMVAVATEDELAQTTVAAPAKRRLRWLGGGVATVAAAMIGFVAVAVALPDQNDALLRDLPVVQQLDLYRAVGEMDFLRQFQAAGIFATDQIEPPVNAASAAAAAPGAVVPTPPPIPETIVQRREWVESLNPADKLELRRNFEKFAALTANEQRSLREFEQQVRADSQADELQRTIQRYHEWLKTLTAAERADLADEPNPQQRVAAIKRIKQEYDSQLFTQLGRRPGTPRDLGNILRWMQAFARDHEKVILAALPVERQQELEKQRGDDQRGNRNYWRRLIWEMWRPRANPLDTLPTVTESDWQSLFEQLTPEMRERLSAASNSEARMQLLRESIEKEMAAMRAQFFATGGRGAGLYGPRSRFDSPRPPGGDPQPARDPAGPPQRDNPRPPQPN